MDKFNEIIGPWISLIVWSIAGAALAGIIILGPERALENTSHLEWPEFLGGTRQW